MQDSAIRTWLDRPTPGREEAGGRRDGDARRRPRDLRDRDGGQYVLRWQAPRRRWATAEWAWHQEHAQEIVNTEAAPYGPDVIGLLADNTSYGVKGDHGGAQESVQRIPIVFYGAGVKAGRTPGTRSARSTSRRRSCVSSGSRRRRRPMGWPTRCPDPTRAGNRPSYTKRPGRCARPGLFVEPGSDVEPVEVHDLDPGRDEVADELLLRRRRSRRPRRAPAARSSSRRPGRRGCRSRSPRRRRRGPRSVSWESSRRPSTWCPGRAG